MLSPFKEKAINCFGIYCPVHFKFIENFFPTGVRNQKKTHAKKFLSGKNLLFLQKKIGFDEKMVIENELSLSIIPFFVMIKSYLKIAKAEKVPIKLSIRLFEGNSFE